MNRASNQRVLWIGAGLVLIALVLLALGALPRLRSNRALAAAAEDAKAATPTVYVTQPQPAVAADLSFAATTQAFQDAVVYARTTGYVSQRLVDIGDDVRAGQLIAEIASPEVDQQLSQAQAELQQAQKTLELQETARELARVTKGRYQAADLEHAVARELVDQSVASERTAGASVAAAEANVASNQANVRRLRALAAFERVVAPFAGTIIRRNVDQGALVTAGSPQITASDPTTGLFEVAQLDTLRVFVSVPQVNAPDIKAGMSVSIDVRGRAQKLSGTVTRTANALDPVTRTLLTEIDIPNPEHKLLPGMFVSVGLRVASSEARWHVPATAVIADDKGTRVVTVGPDNKLHFQAVVLGRDFGGSVDIQSGLLGDELILTQPRISMLEGQTVKPEKTGK